MSASPYQVVAASDGIVELARDGYLEVIRYGANGLVEHSMLCIPFADGLEARQGKDLCF